MIHRVIQSLYYRPNTSGRHYMRSGLDVCTVIGSSSNYDIDSIGLVGGLLRQLPPTVARTVSNALKPVKL